MMKKILLITISLTVFCITAICVGIAKIHNYSKNIKPYPDNINTIPIVVQEASYIFNPDDKSLMSGYSDFIAVAYLEDVKGTSYQEVRYDESILKGTPYTNYSIKIISNIKGKLIIDESIPILQYGGLSIDEKEIVCLSPLLEQGKYYILYLKVSSDNNIYLNKSYELSDITTEEDCLNMLKEPNKYELLTDCINAYYNENNEFESSSHYDTPYSMP